jgi:phosphatidylinositol-3-phosphatase
MEENHSADQILGSPLAPTINAMARSGATLTQMFATRHPSLPNYIALISGDTHGITSDCGKCHVSARNLVDQLEAAGISWKVYLQGLPAPCSASVKTRGAYAKKHNPFEYFDDIANDPVRCSKLVPLTQLSTDIADGTLPQFVWITPDLDHDMHGAGEGGNDRQLIANADAWLGGLYRQLTASPAWRQDTRLVVTWDEGAGGDHNGPHGCCGGEAVGGHIPTVIVGPKVPTTQDGHAYDHYALLRSIETAFGLNYLGHAADPVTLDIAALTQ